MTTTDLRPALRDLDQAIAGKNNELSAAWTDFDKARKSAVEENVNFAENKEAFDKLDAMSTGYDAKRDELADLKARRDGIARIVGQDAVDSSGSKGDELLEEHREVVAAQKIGKTFTQSEAYKTAAGFAQTAGMPIGQGAPVKVADRSQMKTLLSVTVDSADGLAGVPVKDRIGTIVGKPLASLDLLDLIPVGSTDSDVVEWIEETTYTNAAAETDEGDAAPESALELDPKTSNVQDITHFLPVTRRGFADVAFLESWVNERITDGVRRRLLTQILGGNGTAPNLRGLYSTVGIGSVDRSATSTDLIESIHKGMTTIRTTSFVEPDFVGFHPTDWETVRLTRDESGGVSGSGGYQYGPPSQAGPVTMWGLPVVVNPFFTSGKPLLGRSSDCMLWIREGLTVAASDSHSDYFVKKKVAVMGSMRVAFGVLQPKSFCESVA